MTDILDHEGNAVEPDEPTPMQKLGWNGETRDVRCTYAHPTIGSDESNRDPRRYRKSLMTPWGDGAPAG